jgi:hypothetical protein
MKFRFHRGGFNESMATTIEVHSMEELAEKIEFPKEIVFQPCGVDARNGWNTFYVIADDKIVGMSDGSYFDHETIPPKS